ncbi:hypothetical protein WISP_94755 [Willisornis vidua]|uniref:Uncharacterized protein n=1 Tax=Willisornis vidua TaxID=1566151 RepID=A0ABQ9D076_9PASS|nr:hypothetical protein WISP_94755 [Willisornis vidua]
MIQQYVLLAKKSNTVLGYIMEIVARIFFPIFNYVTPEVLPPLWMSSDLASSRFILETAGIVFVGHGGSFWQLLTEAIHLATLLSQPSHGNSMQLNKEREFLLINEKE